MNRNLKVKLTRSAGAAALVAALVVSGVGIAGASSNGAPVAAALSARASNHDHGASKVHPFQGVIASVSGAASMVVTTKPTSVTVNFTTNTKFFVGRTTSSASALTPGQRVFVTPDVNATSANYTAATVRVVPVKIHPIEGFITGTPTLGSLSSPITVAVSKKKSVSVNFSSDTAVTFDHTTQGLVNLAVGERVHITPASSSTTASFVAARIVIQSTKLHAVEGVINALNISTSPSTPSSMTLTTPENPNYIVYFGAATLVASGTILAAPSAANLALSDHVHVVLVPGTTTATPQALLVRVQPLS